jgi:signal transduction histidine kinase
MSYRAFKRLLGETSLERKCRFLFGAATLLLITGSFWWYAWMTENIAYDQARGTGRLLVYHALLKLHLEKWETGGEKLTPEQEKVVSELRERMRIMGHLVPEDLRYPVEIIAPHNAEPEQQQILQEFERNPDKKEAEAYVSAASDADYNFIYRGVVRANDSCIRCHQQLSESRAGILRAAPKIEPNQILGVVNVKMSTRALDSDIHRNRAVLITTALITALLLMGGSYLIVRYVVVKPVKHLKEVSDAISSGELNIRSEIQTGDEFEDLSHAFNRMLRTLVSMQDQLRRVNADLDRKVDELAQANLALYQTGQLKDDFLATMSHELRTPLNSILGFSEVLLSTDPLGDKQKRWVKNIQTSGERLLTLINDVLDLAKIEAGKMQIRVEEFSIHDVCEGLLNMFRPLAEKKNLHLEAQIDQGIPVLRQDANKMQQILWNLLSNAVKFTPEGGRVTVKAETDGVHLILSVIDTGVGIAREDQDVIFEKFRQAARVLTREQQGTGLGLSIVRELAKILGGDVNLRSDLGRGSTFTVTLPLQLTPEPRLSFDLMSEEGTPSPPLPATLLSRSSPSLMAQAPGNGTEASG